ncbi:MAG: hypothetical protein B7C24_03415 [Bacteroidetes bacterium 4572_77]|nr:MAG: hypothetical protein B7C24_03415 [Bacteroidetes bacterium 4572_77]
MNELKTLNILLVDDDDIDIMSFRRTLKKAKIKANLSTCTYAEETLELLQSKKELFDCIFLDYQLPGTDGLQLLKKINNIGIHIPISIMTSHGDEKLAVEMMKAGAFDYFPKSDLSPERLFKKIHSIESYIQIQQEKQAVEESFNKQEKFLRDITFSSPNIIYILDVQILQFQYANRDITEELGYKSNISLTSNFDRIKKLIFPEDFNSFLLHLKKIKQAKNKNAIFEFEYRMLNSKKEWVWYYNRDQAYKFDTQGEVKAILGTTTNINNLKKAEQEYINAKQEAEKALEIKAEFLSNMSHEIRTPMNAIIGLSDIVLMEDHSESVEDNLKSIKQSADNLLVIINDILDFSKMEAGKVLIEKTGFNFHYQLKHVEKTMAFKSNQKNIDAIKFTQQGFVKINTKLLSKTKDNISLKIDVIDSGIGISKEKQHKVFESFTQANVNISREFGGTGLGLAITQQLVHLMKGEVSLESEENKGSKFTISIPFGISHEKIIDNQELKLSEKSLKGLTILVCEDNLINQKVIRQILQQWECKMEIADNGTIGIDKLKNRDFDLVLMDLQMPIMDGFQAAKAIRKGDAGIQNLRIPIIALTADAFPETKEKVLKFGMNDFVSKPFKRLVLNNKIYRMVNRCCPEVFNIII